MNLQQLSDNKITKIESISHEEIVKTLKLSRQMPDVMKSVLNNKIIEETANQEGITLSEEELQQFADRFRFDNNLISSKATLKWLEKYNLSVNEFEELMKSALLTKKVNKYLFEDRVEAYYYAHHLNYSQAVFYEIVLSDFNLAMELFYGIQEQELNFWDLAHQYIQDNELRRRGGYQGIKVRSQLSAEIAASVFAVAPENLPQVLKPIAIDKKTHLIYVEEIIAPELDEPLREQIMNQLFEDWLREQREKVSGTLQIVENGA